MKYVDDEAEEEAEREKNGSHAREARRCEQALLLVDYFGCGTETRDWWNHEPARRKSASAAALENCSSSNIRGDHVRAEYGGVRNRHDVLVENDEISVLARCQRSGELPLNREVPVELLRQAGHFAVLPPRHVLPVLERR